MINTNLQKLEEKASEMALRSIWGETAYKINTAILKMDKNNCAACTRLAKYYRVNNNIIEAKKMYLKTLEIDPTSRGALNNLNDIERDQKENDAIDKIKTTAELQKLGQTSLLKGKYKMAAKLFSKAFSVEPLLTHAIGLAGAYKKMGKFDRIEKLYLQCLECDPMQEDVEAINSGFKMYRMNDKVLTEQFGGTN